MKGFIVCKGNQMELSGAPEIIDLLPLGQVKSQKGDFLVDAESFQSMKEHFEGRRLDLVVDYEHQTLHGGQAPAAGWIKELILGDTAIQARMEWTDAARQYLEHREYRYLSPVVMVRKSDSKAMALHSAALTNTPAIDGMRPIVNSNTFEGGQEEMELLEELATLLGLGEDATAEQIVAGIKTALAEGKALKNAGQTEAIVANKAVCELLGLTADAGADAVTAQITALKATTQNDFNAQAEVLALKEKLADRDAEDAVELALKEGKLSPAMREWGKTYALKDPAGFSTYVKAAPKSVPLEEFGEDLTAHKEAAPDETDLRVCKLMGVSEDDIKKFGKGC